MTGTNSYSIRLITQDAQELSFECAPDENIVYAASKANITLPAICYEGNCGTCHGHCNSGDYEMKSHSANALIQDDERHGGILMCRTFPRSPLSIEVPSDLLHITSGPVPEPMCEVLAVDDMGGGVRRLLLKVLPDESGTVHSTFEPGQFMELEIPGTEIRRAYSISNAPNWSGELEFLIRLQPEGVFSTWVKDKAQVGDTLHTRGPAGSFILHEGGLAPRRFVAGGTGVAPMFSMLRQMAEFQEGHDSRLYFGVTNETDLFALEEIEELKAALPSLSVEVCVWKADSDWQGFSGSPVDAFEADLIKDMDQNLHPEVYLCGPPGLVDVTRSVAAKHGLSHENIFSERFVPS